MKKVHLLIMLLLHRTISIFGLSEAKTRVDPLVSSDSPGIAPISPIYASMEAFAPEIQIGHKEQTMHLPKKVFIALVVASSAFAAFILFFSSLWIYQRKFSKNSQKNNPHNSDAEKGVVSLTPILGKLSSLNLVGKKGSITFIDFKTLEKATNNFGDSDIIGEGGFGRVYKGQLDDNHHVAVKKINSVGEEAEDEFKNEAHILGKVQHPNIISLLGYSNEGDTRLLVYELMDKGSLENQLHGPSHGSALSWHMRMKIALDIARGLEYLHEHCKPQVIHRDLKSSNILLDINFNAKISDFGLAVMDGAQNKNNLKLSGTVGYVAPEYLLDGKLTDKSDVYAFGVVLLELLLGRKPVEKLSTTQCQSIVTWAMPQLTDRTKLPNIVDTVIKDTMDLKHLYQVAAVAVLCVQPEPSYRPLITDVLHSLIPLVHVELGGTLRVNQ